MQLDLNLLNKYNANIPRYTSYPTILDWQDNLPSADWFEHLKTEVEKGHPIALYIHIPFCKSLCTFCACNKIITKQYDRAKIYVDYLIKEFDLYLAKLGKEKLRLKEVHIGGGTPNYLESPELKKLFEHILSKSEVDADKLFSIEIDPRTVDDMQLQTLYNLGFRRISLGIQDFDARVQKIINRVQSFECVEQVVNSAREIGFTSVNFDILYGLPDQTKKSIDLTMSNIKFLKPDRLAFYSYAHVPWFSKSQGHHEKFNLPLGDEKMQLFLQGRKHLLDLGYKEIGMDHFSFESDSLYMAYREGKLHRNFMGYIESFVHPMIGLGTSSISDAWGVFVQNTKDVKSYMEAIDKGEIHIIKSHRLTENQQNSRQKILDIMTQFQTKISEEEHAQILESGKEMLADGLISFREKKLQVEELGKFFLRNICTLFDENFQKKEDRSRKFSKSI